MWKSHGETLGKWSTNGEFSWVFYIEMLVYGRLPTVHSSSTFAKPRLWHIQRRHRENDILGGGIGPCWGVWHAKKWWFNHQTWELYMVMLARSIESVHDLGSMDPVSFVVIWALDYLKFTQVSAHVSTIYVVNLCRISNKRDWLTT